MSPDSESVDPDIVTRTPTALVYKSLGAVCRGEQRVGPRWELAVMCKTTVPSGLRKRRREKTARRRSKMMEDDDSESASTPP